MSTLVPIVVVSHARAGRVVTRKLFDDPDRDIAICVAESQLPLYREAYPDAEYLVHPDDVVGIGAKRQWIYDTLGDVFMVDDDIEAVIDMSEPDSRKARVRGDRLIGIIERAHDTATQLGVYVYGFTGAQNVVQYQPQSPLHLSRRIPGWCWGLRAGSKLWFHPEVTVVDDDWMVCLNAHHHRIALIDQRYGFKERRNTVQDRSGGQGAVRTMANHRRDIEVLVQAFGPEVIRLGGHRELSQRTGFTVHLPF